MSMTRRAALATCLATGLAHRVRAAEIINVVFAGSMGVVMDKGIGPAYLEKTGILFQGLGQGAMALAQLLVARSITADVFIPVSPGPVKVVEGAGLVDPGNFIPIASTEMVLAYSPKSHLAPHFAAAGASVPQLLTLPGMRFGRTDPAVDPQGAYVLYALQLAEIYYQQPGLAAKVSGPMQNPSQIFAEPSLLARLQDGEIDATLGYKSAVLSQKLPYIALPAEINLSNPALSKPWYGKATLTLKGKPAHPGPLVFYAARMRSGPNPRAARSFMDLLTGPDGQAIFAKYGYGPPMGKAI